MSDWKSFREEMGAAFHTQMLAIPYADHCQKHQVNQVLMFRMLSSAACATEFYLYTYWRLYPVQFWHACTQARALPKGPST